MGTDLSTMPVIGEIKHGNELGKKHNKQYIFASCPKCGLPRWIELRRFNKTRGLCFKCAMKSGIHPRGERSHAWKGGKQFNNGYIRVQITPDDPLYPMAYQENGLILEHRLVMARHLGRILESKEFVRHRNGIREDNRIENLELKLDGQHLKEHSMGYKDGYHQGYKSGYEKGKHDALAQIKSFV